MGSRGTFMLCTDVRGSMKYSPHMHLTICMHSPPQTKAWERDWTSVVLVPRQDSVWERGVLQSGAHWQYCRSATVQRRVVVQTHRRRTLALLTPGP